MVRSRVKQTATAMQLEFPSGSGRQTTRQHARIISDRFDAETRWQRSDTALEGESQTAIPRQRKDLPLATDRADKPRNTETQSQQQNAHKTAQAKWAPKAASPRRQGSAAAAADAL